MNSVVWLIPESRRLLKERVRPVEERRNQKRLKFSDSWESILGAFDLP